MHTTIEKRLHKERKIRTILDTEFKRPNMYHIQRATRIIIYTGGGNEKHTNPLKNI